MVFKEQFDYIYVFKLHNFLYLTKNIQWYISGNTRPQESYLKLYKAKVQKNKEIFFLINYKKT